MAGLIRRAVHWLRGPIYRIGLRPRPGSIWFSPSLAMQYAIAKAAQEIAEAWVRAFNEISETLAAVTAAFEQFDAAMVTDDETDEDARDV